ncbi:MAG: DUF721 domain-containing protein [Nitrospiraceae bacterium]|nr:DUF721 domain-containing protein [Nitrospiraceae bacterium]
MSATIEKVLSRRGMAGKLREYRLFVRWSGIVGQAIGRHARPTALRAKKLTVTVDSSAWMQQLSLLRPEIVAKVNSALGEQAVESITLRMGEVEGPAPAREVYQPPTGTLAPDEAKKVDESASAIADPELREAFRHLMAKDLLNKKRRKQ